jgi:hypothetical protein
MHNKICMVMNDDICDARWKCKCHKAHFMFLIDVAFLAPQIVRSTKLKCKMRYPIPQNI